VRFIGNHSSGKMASALALALYTRGANPTYVTTIKNDSLPSQINQIVVQTSEEMKDQLEQSIQIAKRAMNTAPTLMRAGMPEQISKEPFLFMAAAVADYKPAKAVNGKIKKENTGEKLTVELVQTSDILGSLDKNGMKFVGFKAEFDEKTAKASAKKMLKNKNLDAVCLNILSDVNSFGSDTNEIEFIFEKANVSIASNVKLVVAFEILELSKQL